MPEVPPDPDILAPYIKAGAMLYALHFERNNTCINAIGHMEAATALLKALDFSYPEEEVCRLLVGLKSIWNKGGQNAVVPDAIANSLHSVITGL